MLFSTAINAEINTDEIARTICITNEGYEEGFYSQNNTVLCRTAVAGTQQAMRARAGSAAVSNTGSEWFHERPSISEALPRCSASGRPSRER